MSSSLNSEPSGFYWVASDPGERCDNFFAFAVVVLVPPAMAALVAFVPMELIRKVLDAKNRSRDK